MKGQRKENEEIEDRKEQAGEWKEDGVQLWEAKRNQNKAM